LTAVKFWTRTKFKGTWTLKRHVNPTRVPIETKESYRWLENLRQSIALVGTPERCVHVADRESDIYELFCLAQDLGARFLGEYRPIGWPPPLAPSNWMELIGSCPSSRLRLGRGAITSRWDRMRRRACT